MSQLETSPARAFWMIGTGVVAAVLMGLGALVEWAVEGIHDTQVEQGRHLAALAATMDGIVKQVDRVGAGVETLRTNQIDQTDLARLEMVMGRQISEFGARLESLDGRVQQLERGERGGRAPR